jgi:hypothetical protein
MNWMMKESWPIMWLLMKYLQSFECCEFPIKNTCGDVKEWNTTYPTHHLGIIITQ